VPRSNAPSSSLLIASPAVASPSLPPRAAGASTSAPCASSPRGLPPLRVFAMAGQKDGRGGPRNRTGRTHDPYSTPLRDANRDRLYGMLTARAAMTLLTYLTEINKAGATFFQEYMANNPIPYAFWASGKVKDVSGETFIEGLLAMSPTNIEEKYRDNYITVDPPALAVRLLDIRCDAMRCDDVNLGLTHGV